MRWYWSGFKQNGLILFPHRTLVNHFGNDDSGTNYRGKSPNLDVEFSSKNTVTDYPVEIIADDKFYSAVHSTISRQQSVLNKGFRYISQWF